MLSSRPRSSGSSVAVVIPSSGALHRSNSQHAQSRGHIQGRISGKPSTPNAPKTTTGNTSVRIPYSAKGKWKAAERELVDSDDEYIGSHEKTKVDATYVSSTARDGIRQIKQLTFTQTKPRSRNATYTKPASSPPDLSKQKGTSQTVKPVTCTPFANKTHIAQVSSVSVSVKAPQRHRQISPPRATEAAPTQCILDRPPPTPPPLPSKDHLPWYMVYAPEVAWARLDTKEENDLKQDIDYLSEGSQGKNSGSKMTTTSLGALSRTPAKNRMRMVERGRSRSRRLTRAPGEETGSSAAESGNEGASPARSVQDSAGSAAEISSDSTSDSDSDREETDGTDTELEELIEFKNVTRLFKELKPQHSSSSSATLLTITRKKRKPFLEEVLPDTYGPKHAPQLSKILMESAKPGLGPRALARKSFAKAIGARSLAKKR